jgi:hypothetical protein
VDVTTTNLTTKLAAILQEVTKAPQFDTGEVSAD